MSDATPRVRLVCFDLGRVLIRICDGWAQACRCAGVAFDGDEPAFLRTPAAADLLRRLDVGTLGLDDFYRGVADLSGCVGPEQVRAALDAYLLGPFPGALELIDELHARGIATACLSNTNANHWAQMTAPDGPNALPLDRLTFRFASHLMRTRKPQREVYEQVERDTGLPGATIVFFDDVLENVEAARACGWLAHQIDTARDPIVQARERLRRYDVL